MLLLIAATLFVAAAGVWWLLQKQQKQRAADARAATLFKPAAGGLGNLGDALARHNDNGGWSDGDDSDEADGVVGGERRDGAHPQQDADAVGDRAGPNDAVALNRHQKHKHGKQQDRLQRRQEVSAAVAEQRRKQKEAELRDAEAAALEQEKQDEEEAALATLREERKQQEDAGYRQWVGQIGLESKGELGAEDDQQKRLKDYLAQGAPSEGTKVLELEDVANRYSIPVDRLVAVIEQCVKSGAVSGVFDDRGKFIYITDSEYAQLARFLRLRGRVSMSELIREANRIVTVEEDASKE